MCVCEAAVSLWEEAVRNPPNPHTNARAHGYEEVSKHVTFANDFYNSCRWTTMTTLNLITRK